MEHGEKINYLFDHPKIDGMLITSGTNRRYLTGFTGSAGVVLLTKKESILIVDFRYAEQAKAQVNNYLISSVNDRMPFLDEVVRLVNKLGVTRLGFEQNYVSYELYTQLIEQIPCELVPLSRIIEKFRMIKTSEEIRKMRTAAEITDAAFSQILNILQPGITELEVANELEFFMRKQGAASSAFDIIVASGHRSALPHGLASTKAIEKGDMVTLDFGAYYQGYRSDMTRTIAVGEPSEKLKEIYHIVYNALENALVGIKPGISGREADALSRNYITDKGYGVQYGHGSGHGVGLDIHEYPFMSPKCEEFIKPGMVLTVEPGIYLANLGGVRIEDEILVTNQRNEILSKSRKDLIIL
jgi:Xaa-Pro aminopeptidase